MKKLPSVQFYPGDWMKDPALRAVSYAARGLWIDLLCLMHESERRGYLVHSTGKTVTDEQLARMTGGDLAEVRKLIRELEDCGVFSRDESGTIFSRRIVRDERKRHLCSEAGKDGGGNPDLKGEDKGTPKGQSKGGAKGHAKGSPKQNRGSSSSSSSSDSVPDRKADPSRSVETVGEGGFASYLTSKLPPKNSQDIQFLALVGRAVDGRHIAEDLAQSALVGCNANGVRKPIAMFTAAIKENIKAAGSTWEAIEQQLAGQEVQA